VIVKYIMENNYFVRPLTLKVDKEIWERFKKMVHRDTSMNNAVCLLIHDFVNKKEEIIDLRKAK